MEPFGSSRWRHCFPHVVSRPPYQEGEEAAAVDEEEEEERETGGETAEEEFQSLVLAIR